MENKLLFEDNFDGTTLDKSKWARCPEWNRQGPRDIWDDKMSYLDGNGHLILRAEWNADDGKVHSGAIRTKEIYEEGLAYYEASIRFPTAKGIWGAFWMMVGAVVSEEKGAEDGVEIDIIESIFASDGKCNSALHWDGYGASHKSIAKTIPEHRIYDGGFHTFGLWRRADGYRFYIDGVETVRILPEDCAVCTLSGYMKLTVEAADWCGAGTDEAIAALPAEMVVDWVRVYETKPE